MTVKKFLQLIPTMDYFLIENLQEKILASGFNNNIKQDYTLKKFLNKKVLKMSIVFRDNSPAWLINIDYNVK